MQKINGVLCICKSDIDKDYKYLCSHGFGSLTKAELKDFFDDYVFYVGVDEVKITGHPTDKHRQRSTWFISLNHFYRYIFKF
ncbi:MAG: hypothetical protein J6K39_02830 [Clostridia bacterium]|nr:hypothetical protein [Clostridia bacterium]